ncbi:MAG: LysR family transcriptional regulator [Marmoricola sp.]
MTITQLAAFVAAARTGTFTAAAVELKMSQPAISDLVRRLEDEIGAPLFGRVARGLQLTPAGEQLLPHAQGAIESVQAGADAVKALRDLEGGTATFGLLRNADLYLQDGLVRRFHDKHPNVRIRLVGQNSAETGDDVRAGRLEAGLVILPIEGSDDLNVLPLVRDEIMYVSADPAHVAAPPSIGDICDRRMILYDAHFSVTDPMRRQLADRAQLEGRHLSPIIEVEYLAPAIELVAAGLGDSLVPGAALGRLVDARGLHATCLQEPLFDVVALIRRRGYPISPATREFARLAHEVLVARAHSADSTVELLHEPASVRSFLH